MIYLNGVSLEDLSNTLPNKELFLLPNRIKEVLRDDMPQEIIWRYNYGFDDLASIYFLKTFIDNYYEDNPKFDNRVILYMPYLPYGRADKSDRENEIHMLSYFASLINNLEFFRVHSTNPHSTDAFWMIQNFCNNDVMPILLERVFQVTKAAPKECLLIFPDESAYSRNQHLLKSNTNYLVFKKTRENGKVTSLLPLKGNVTDKATSFKHLFIIDDICVYGGTFIKVIDEMALKFPEVMYGIKEISLLVAHCERNVNQGNLPGRIKRIITTDSMRDFNSTIEKHTFGVLTNTWKS